MRPLAAAAALAIAALLAGCSSGPSASFKDGYYYAEGHGGKGSPYWSQFSDLAAQCSVLAPDFMTPGDDSGQWEAGCVSEASGQSLP
jgi:hypothetical protein